MMSYLVERISHDRFEPLELQQRCEALIQPEVGPPLHRNEVAEPLKVCLSNGISDERT